MDRINPTSDLAFKKVFASPEHKDVPQGLIWDFMGIKANNIIIENPYSIEGNLYKRRFLLAVRQNVRSARGFKKQNRWFANCLTIRFAKILS